MNISEFLINTSNPKSVVKQVKNFINTPCIKDALEAGDYDKISRFMTGYGWEEAGVSYSDRPALGHQAGGLFWAIIRDSEGDVVDQLGYIPSDYYAYNNIKELVDYKSKNIEYIDSSAFYKSNLKAISLPNTIKNIYSRAFCDLDTSTLLILFNGTKKDWRSIKKDATIFNDPYSEKFARVIRCNDGDIERN